MKRRILVLAVLVFAGARARADQWPDLSSPARAVGGGEQDAAVVVGVESYAFVPPVAGAESNAKAWYDYLTKTRGASAGRVKLLLKNDAAREDILSAAQKAAAKAGPDGTLWFVFIGHGAPSADGKDGLLVGVDAQQKAESLQTRSVKRGELVNILEKSRAKKIVVLLDACFSGRGQDGSSIAPGLQPLVTVSAAAIADPRMVVLTAAKGDQFAGPLPGADRPAFSYLTLGALRGWAGSAKVTAGDLWRYASEALDATLRGRNQTPELIGKENEVIGMSVGEPGPDLTALAKATAGGGEGFKVTNLPSVPTAVAPRALDQAGAASLDFRSMDVDALEKYSAAAKLDKSEAEPEDKAAGWRQLAKDAPKFADLAQKRAEAWDRFAAERQAAAEANKKRIEARDADWAKLSRLLDLDESVIPELSKEKWSTEFFQAYAKLPGIAPEMAKVLADHVAPGRPQNKLKALARKAPPKTEAEAPARTERRHSGGLASEEDKILYALGTRANAEAVKPLQLSPDELALVEMGQRDAMAGGNLRVDFNVYGPKLNNWYQNRKGQIAKRRFNEEKAYRDNAAASATAVLPNGAIYTELRAGTGAKPGPQDTVRVHYEGTFVDGTIFDSSIQRGQPAEFPLNGAIDCWTQGVQQMRVGGKARLVCPPASAYGDIGNPKGIPGGATLTFEVELLDVVRTRLAQ